MYLSAAEAEAFCPACIFGAGIGVAEAVNNSDVWKMGIWLSILLAACCCYIMKRCSVDRHLIFGVAMGFAFSIIAALFLRGLTVIFGVLEAQTSAILDQQLLYLGSVLTGANCAYLSSLTACVVQHYGRRIPFLQLILVLTIGYIVAGIK